jgi:hypothetical protein
VRSASDRGSRRPASPAVRQPFQAGSWPASGRSTHPGWFTQHAHVRPRTWHSLGPCALIPALIPCDPHEDIPSRHIEEPRVLDEAVAHWRLRVCAAWRDSLGSSIWMIDRQSRARRGLSLRCHETPLFWPLRSCDWHLSSAALMGRFLLRLGSLVGRPFLFELMVDLHTLLCVRVQRSSGQRHALMWSSCRDCGRLTDPALCDRGCAFVAGAVLRAPSRKNGSLLSAASRWPRFAAPERRSKQVHTGWPVFARPLA